MIARFFCAHFCLDKKYNKQLINNNINKRKTPMENNYMLVDANIDLVNKMAKQIMKKNTNCDWLTEDDLVGAGHEAIVIAARSYDASRNASFRTYASTCIRNAMLAEIRNMFPVKVNDKQQRLFVVRNEDAVRETMMLELSGFQRNWDHEQRWLMETLLEAKALLKHDEKWLLDCYYGFEGEPMTLKEIATLLQVSPQAIHKRLTRVHDKLRNLAMDSSPSYSLCA